MGERCAHCVEMLLEATFDQAALLGCTGRCSGGGGGALCSENVQEMPMLEFRSIIGIITTEGFSECCLQLSNMLLNDRGPFAFGADELPAQCAGGGVHQ